MGEVSWSGVKVIAGVCNRIITGSVVGLVPALRQPLLHDFADDDRYRSIDADISNCTTEVQMSGSVFSLEAHHASIIITVDINLDRIVSIGGAGVQEKEIYLLKLSVRAHAFHAQSSLCAGS
jgi:hypothetical protein